MKKNKIFDLLLNPIFVICFLLVLFSITAFRLDLAYDESLWTYMGGLWNERGIPPYLGAVENKTPGIFMLYAISDFLTSGNIFFVRGIGVIATLITAIFLYKIGVKIHNKTSSIICLYVFGFVTCWDSMDGFAFAHTEVFMILFTTMSFYFFVCLQRKPKIFKWLFLSGLSVGMAIVFKQIAITSAIALVWLFLVINRENKFPKILKGTSIIIFGICLPTFLSYLVLSFFGVSFNDYIEGAWLILFNSGSKIQGFGMHFSNFIETLLFSRFVLFYPLIFLFLLRKDVLGKPYKAILIFWMLFDFIGVNSSGYYFGHQIKQWLPVFSLIAGISIYNLIIDKFTTAGENIKAKVVLTILVIGIICFPYRQIYSNTKLAIKYDYSLLTPQEEIANWLMKNSTKDSYIYIVGGEVNLIRTLAISQRMSSSKYFHSIFLTSNSERDILFMDLQQNTPKFILKDKFIDEELFNKYGLRFKSFFEKNYKLVKTMYNVEIYQQF